MTKPFPPPETTLLTGASLLIVDDSAACRMMSAAMARALGAEAETAETAIQALAKSQAESFDLIILDVGLADSDGRVLTRTLRETPNGAGAAILCVSGLGGDQRRQSALNAGADEFVEKPFDGLPGFAAIAIQTLNQRAAPACAITYGGAAPAISTPDLSSSVAAHAAEDLKRGESRLHKAVANGDVGAVRRAAHFLSGVAGLIGAGELESAANAVQGAKGDAGGLRAVETMLTLAFEARHQLGASI
ncbi:MAG: response regulator [Pseudomonadota bacterium]